MKKNCPVCKNEIKSTDTKCRVCGFDEEGYNKEGYDKYGHSKKTKKGISYFLLGDMSSNIEINIESNKKTNANRKTTSFEKKLGL